VFFVNPRVDEVAFWNVRGPFWTNSVATEFAGGCERLLI
jgi:hypothetical protein